MVNKIITKSEDEISREWDKIVERRTVEIKCGNDKSFWQLMLPQIKKRIKETCKESCQLLIDCGCGSGEMLINIEDSIESGIGIDISKKSIELASRNKNTKLDFFNVSIEEFAKENIQCADVCVLNMLLSNVINHKKICKDVYSMLKDGGRIMIIVPHPCYWPLYWDYYNEDWFEYKEQICMMGDFAITDVGIIGQSTHVHRPLESYINSLIGVGFRLTYIEELYSKDCRGKGDFPNPRFLYIEGTR